MTLLAHCVGQLSSANKRKLVAECHRLGILGNMNVVLRVLQCRIAAHLNALHKAIDKANGAIKLRRLDVLSVAISGDLSA